MSFFYFFIFFYLIVSLITMCTVNPVIDFVSAVIPYRYLNLLPAVNVIDI